MGQRGRKRIEDKHPELLEMLGVQSDKELAEQFGCTPVTIGNARRRAGLPYHRSPRTRSIIHGMKEAEKDLHMVVVPHRLTVRESGEERVDVLHGHDGVRVYHKDAVDYRITMGMTEDLPHFHSWDECKKYLTEEPGAFRPCLLDLYIARQVFSSSFSEPYSIAPDPTETKALDKIRAAAKANKPVRLSASEVQALVRV